MKFIFLQICEVEFSLLGCFFLNHMTGIEREATWLHFGCGGGHCNRTALGVNILNNIWWNVLFLVNCFFSIVACTTAKEAGRLSSNLVCHTIVCVQKMSSGQSYYLSLFFCRNKNKLCGEFFPKGIWFEIIVGDIKFNTRRADTHIKYTTTTTRILLYNTKDRNPILLIITAEKILWGLFLPSI